MRLFLTVTAAVTCIMTTQSAMATQNIATSTGRVIQTDTLIMQGKRQKQSQEKVRLQFIDNEKITITEPIRFTGQRNNRR